MIERNEMSIPELNYKRYGSGKPILILHGFLGSLDNWHTLATEFGKSGFEVYTLDMRNHGRSPHTSQHSISLMVDDVKLFIEQHNLISVSLLGHSMGGKVAMQFALTYPELIDNLVVVDIAPRAYKSGHDDVFDAIRNIDLDSIQSRKEAEEMMKPFLGDFSTRQFILKNLERNEDGKYQWKFNFEVLHRDYAEMISAIYSTNIFEGPTLFIKGANSIYIQENDRSDIEKYFPNATIQVIELAAHWVHADQPKLFFDTVINFLNR